MRNLNFDDLPGEAPEEKTPETHKPYVPWHMVERAARGDPEAVRYVGKDAACRLVEEREKAYRYSEAQIV